MHFLEIFQAGRQTGNTAGEQGVTKLFDQCYTILPSSRCGGAVASGGRKSMWVRSQ